MPSSNIIDPVDISLIPLPSDGAGLSGPPFPFPGGGKFLLYGNRDQPIGP